MAILVLNLGSSSLKTAVFGASGTKRLWSESHSGPSDVEIRWLQQRRPELPQWACFGTAFHSTLPEAAYSYAIPQALQQQGYRRFGFHGINHDTWPSRRRGRG